MSDFEKDARRRRKLVDDINGALAGVSLARARLTRVEQKYRELEQKLRSERGTAEAELRKATDAYHALRARLEKLLPPEVGDAYDGEALAQDPHPVIEVEGITDEMTVFSPEEVQQLGDDELHHQAALRFDMGAETVTFRPAGRREA